MKRVYQICTRCIMDTTDPDIQFDENEVCNHCRGYDEKVKQRLFRGEAGQKKINKLVNEIKIKGKNKKYDCIIGVSGGVDSTFVAFKVKELGLRPLAVHVDNGWDSELAVENIKDALKRLDIDLHTYSVEWEEFKDLQLSFLRASVPDAEIPTDHALMAVLYHVAAKVRVQFYICGYNITTEGILPTAWSYGHRDWKYIKSVHKKFGTLKLRSFSHCSLFGFLYYNFVKRIKTIRILNYMTYNKEDAMEVIKQELGWESYGGKHHESIYTRFLQAYILPRKFNIDKRRAHLSSLICSGQITRAEALEEMKHEPYPSEEIAKNDKEYVLEKLGLTEAEFEEIMSLPIKTFRDYPSNHWLFQIVRKYGSRILMKLRVLT